MAATNKDLKKLPSGGRTGKWKFSVSQGGFMTAKNYLEVLADIDQYLTDNEIERPVVVFIDGYPGRFDCQININHKIKFQLFLGHMSEEVAEFCVLKKIKLWLLKPFSTHVKQPLDVSTFEPSFKVYLFQIIRVWQSQVG